MDAMFARGEIPFEHRLYLLTADIMDLDADMLCSRQSVCLENSFLEISALSSSYIRSDSCMEERQSWMPVVRKTCITGAVPYYNITIV